MLITIDTNLMIWGVRQTASAGQESKIQPAVGFLKSLDEQQNQIAITAQALSEYLFPIGDDEARDLELIEISKRFIILPLSRTASRESTAMTIPCARSHPGPVFPQ